MVKIKLKSIVLYFVMLMFLMSVAYAARQALEFSDVDVRVGSKTSKNVKNGDTINEEAEPGDAVEFRVEVKNNFTSAENLEIEDISVTVTIDELDDGDEVEEESKEFDLKPGNDKRVTLKFQVPLEVEEDTFNVEIEAEGDDENNTDQRIVMKLKLEVEKESHMLKITRKTLSPAEVACSRKNVQLGVTVINIGNEDEEDVKFHVLSEDLGLDIKENAGELEAEPNEESSRFVRTYTFNVPADAEAGSYPITLRALYDDDRRKAEETVTLTVNDCPSVKVEEETVETTQTVAPTGQTTATVEVPEDTVVTQESFLSGNAFIVGIIALEVIAVIVGIVLLVSFLARRG